MFLVKPSLAQLPGYVDALERGWSSDTLRGAAAADEELDRIDASPAAFVEQLDDPDAAGAPIRMPDGSFAQRLPGFVRWLWDGEFCGSIGFRWSPGTTALPPTCLGHIGYTVVPWKTGRGYAKAALAQILPEARRRGLPFVDLVTDVDNIASQRVILSNGGVFVERFTRLPALGSTDALRFRIHL